MSKPMLEVIGARAWLDITQFALTNIEAKIDTGAHYSTIHGWARLLDGAELPTLEYGLMSADPDNHALLRTLDFKEVLITNSLGAKQKRFVVSLEVLLNKQSYKGWFSLTNRKSMPVPILLGRDFLEGRFLVDVSKDRGQFWEEKS